MSERNITATDIPAILLLEKLRQGFQKAGLTLGRIIIRERRYQLAGITQLVENACKHGDHFRNSCRISTAQHNSARLGQSLCQIIHQMSNTRVRLEAPAEVGKVHEPVS